MVGGARHLAHGSGTRPRRRPHLLGA
jgi:hypothetical protein